MGDIIRRDRAERGQTEALEDIESLMSETPSAGNFGKKAANSLPDPDLQGEEWGEPKRGLSSKEDADEKFAHGGQAQVITEADAIYHGMVSDRERTDSSRTVTRKELAELDADPDRAAALRAHVLTLLGFTEADMAILDKPGRPSGDAAALRVRFEGRLLEVQEAGGGMLDLARALGWPVLESPTGTGCKRMAEALKRARARRDAASQA